MLLDADGVLQHLPGGWVDAVRRQLGDRAEEFLEEAWRVELDALRGDRDFLVDLATTLEAWGHTVSAQDLHDAVWHSIALVPETIALVPRLQAAGYGVHLGTNQERHRAAYMREELGYDGLFDVSCYSCELGVAKPDPEFFVRAVDRIGAEPAQVLFVDDLADNVAAARSAGLAAERWRFDDPDDDGLAGLLKSLDRHGVRPAA